MAKSHISITYFHLTYFQGYDTYAILTSIGEMYDFITIWKERNLNVFVLYFTSTSIFMNYLLVIIELWKRYCIFSFPQTYTNFLSTQQKHRKYLYIFNKYILIYFTGITDRSFSWRIFIGTIYEFFGQRQWWKEGCRHRLFENVFQGRQMLWLYFSHATKDVPQFKQNSTG